jgi:hypothetical protein
MKHMTAMPDNCPECGQDFWIETGFYWGAFYVSYVLGVAFCLPCFALLLFLLHIPFVWALVSTILLYIVITPYTTRLSRAIWLTIFHNVGAWDK